MEFWQAIHFTDEADLVELAQAAEALGITGLVLGDHLVLPQHHASAYPYTVDGRSSLLSSSPFPDPFVAIAVMASATRTLQFATGVYILPLRDPFSVAKSVATVARFAPGRMALGIGVGWLAEEFNALGMDFSTRGRRTDEMIDVMRLLWAGGPASHQGEFYRFADIEFSPVPTTSVPILVGGTSDRAIRRAARNDGWMALGLDADALSVALKKLEAYRSREGNSQHDVSTFKTYVSISREFAREVESLAKLGVTAAVIPPSPVGTSVSARVEAMEQAARAVFAAVGRTT